MVLSRTSIVLIGMCVGLLAAALTYSYLIKERARAARLTRPVPVVVAIRPITARTVIEPTAVRTRMLPAGTLPANCATSVEEVAGQVALATLRENEPVQRKAVASPTVTLGMAYGVPEGMRAVAVALDPVIGVAGFLKPGDRVDVVTTLTDNDVKVTKTVLQDVTLLAIGPSTRTGEESPSTTNRSARPREEPTATLAVTPAQAERLILAEAGGKLRLTLRPAGDRKIVVLTGIRSDMLIDARGASSARAPATPAPTPRHNVRAASPSSPPSRPAVTRDTGTLCVETIRGTDKATVAVSTK